VLIVSTPLASGELASTLTVTPPLAAAPLGVDAVRPASQTADAN